MLDRLFTFVLILNATALFGFIAPQIGVSIANVSLALLFINCLYLLSRARRTLRVLLNRGMAAWTFVLLVWPLLTLSYAPTFEVRNIGVQFYLFSLFLCTVVYTTANGLRAIHRVLSFSLSISYLGLLLSIVHPGYFYVVSDLAGASVEREGRAFGFFLQPNSLAIGLGLLFIGWFALWPRKGTLRIALAISLLIAAMLATGSRTGVLVTALVAVFILFPTLKSLTNGRYIVRVAAVTLCIGAAALGAQALIARSGDSGTDRADLLGRTEAMLSLSFSGGGGVLAEGSVRERLVAQASYVSLVLERPLLGHGFGSDTAYQSTGRLPLSAHSAALSTAMEYGVFYPVAVIALLVLLYRKRARRGMEKTLRTNSVLQFAVVSGLLFVISGFIDSRTFYVVFGVFFATVYCAKLVFEVDLRTGHVKGVRSQRSTSDRIQAYRLSSSSTLDSAGQPH